MANSPEKLPRYADLPCVPGNPPKTAWGLFGPEDDVGMFHLQTPERIAAAARLVRQGALFPMNWDQSLPDPPLFGRKAMVHTVSRNVPVGYHGDDHLDQFYTQASSQWDALGHVGDFEHGFWGGVTYETLAASPGRLGIDHWARRGIAGRAVLLDVARQRAAQGRAIDCSAADPIRIEDLEATLRTQGVALETGDVVLIRTGWIGWYEQQDRATRERLAKIESLRLPGLECSEAMAEYLFDHHPCALCSDTPALEVWPPPGMLEPEGFLHHWILGRFGMAIGEMFVLDALAESCARDGVYESFFVAAPLHVRGGTGSPPNAIALK